jgi:hypothetical protein
MKVRLLMTVVMISFILLAKIINEIDVSYGTIYSCRNSFVKRLSIYYIFWCLMLK